MQIKAASPADADILAQLHAQHFKRAWSRVEFNSFFERDGVIAYIAQKDEKPIGFIFCWAVVGECELLCLAVEEAYRQQGIARALCDKAMVDSVQRGVSVMHLEVALSNDAARRLYASLGFEIMRKRKDYYHYPDGGCEDAVTMRRELV